ncbi:MAG: amidohydrolase family protein, partial [Acholeplasmataceae bacterium]|nr:amidohydrolase family protein [Acholeplasmataceae bacterium]
MSRILIKDTEILTKQGTQTYNLVIDGDRIAYIGKDLPDNIFFEAIIDGKDLIAVPGMVNAHTHAAMTLLRSYADDMLLMDWLQNKIWPAEANLTDDDVYWGTQLAIVEMLKSGTTTFADMYFFMDKVGEAVAETGIRASLARGMIGAAPDAEEKLAESVSLYKNWHGQADGRIRVMFGPHAPYTCSPD